ncbi:hypothetical protein [Rheinheimera sp.]|uniref:hypothetical protein n=1 Tax=Rheinheimera sp. TaxID=1869214 RepID=UPI002353A509|nr:hypothetical protein [Rheinheimera sp.]
MSELNLIKTVLFNAASLNEALTRLDDLGISYREFQLDAIWAINSHDVYFSQAYSCRFSLAVCINGKFQSFNDRKPFLAGQCETVETPVPAASPETTGQHPDNFYRSCPKCGGKTPCYIVSLYGHCKQCQYPVIPEPSTDSVDKATRNWLVKFYPKADMRKQILRTERRLKNSRVKGLSS